MIKRIIYGQNFWEILERIIGKISSIIGAGPLVAWSISEGRVDQKQDNKLCAALYSLQAFLARYIISHCKYHLLKAYKLITIAS